MPRSPLSGRSKKARRQQARADALYRRSVDSSAVGMCLVDAEGGFVDVNGALCEFFGYDAQTLKSKTWQELTAEEYLQADLDKVAAVLAGEIDSRTAWSSSTSTPTAT